MISANGGLLAHRYTPQVTQRWPRGSEPASTREHGIQTCQQVQGLLKRVWILFTQSPPMGLWIARPNVWPNFYPDLKIGCDSSVRGCQG